MHPFKQHIKKRGGCEHLGDLARNDGGWRGASGGTVSVNQSLKKQITSNKCQ